MLIKNVATFALILFCLGVQAVDRPLSFQKTEGGSYVLKNGDDELVFDLSKKDYIILNGSYKVNIYFTSNSDKETLYAKSKEDVFYVKKIDGFKVIKDTESELEVSLAATLEKTDAKNDFNLEFHISSYKSKRGFELETRLSNLSGKNVVINIVNCFALLSDKFQGENSSVIIFDQKRARENSGDEWKWAKLLCSNWIFLYGKKNDNLGIASPGLRYFEKLRDGCKTLLGVKKGTIKKEGVLYNRLTLRPEDDFKNFLLSLDSPGSCNEPKIINDFWRSKLKDSWDIKPRKWRAFKLQKYGKSILPDKNIGLALWTGGIKYENNQYICNIDELCKAVKGAGFNTVPLQVSEKDEYFLKGMEKCIENGLYVTLMRNYFRPFKYYNNMTYPSPEEFLELAKKMRSIAEDNLIGISDIEYDGTLCRPLAFSKHISALKWKGTSDDRREVYEKAVQFFRSLNDNSKDKNRIKSLSHCESSLQYILAEAGSDLIGNIAYGNKMNTELSLAYTRGTCRQYDIYMGAAPQIWGGRPFNWYPGQPFWTKGRDKLILPVLDNKKVFSKCRFCGADEEKYSKKMYSDRDLFYYCSKCGSSTGKPPEGLFSSNLLSYFSGCRYFEAELHAHAYIHIKPPYGNLPYGKAYQDIKSRDKIFKTPGDPVTPIAVMIDPANGWNAPYKYIDSRVWGRQQWMGHEETMFKYFEFFYPYCLSLFKQPVGQDFPGSFTYTPHGQIDVINSKIDLDRLKHYHCILLMGWHRMSNNLLDKLYKYVENGGMLVMNVNQLKQFDGKYVDSSRVGKLFGVKLGSSFQKSDASFFAGVDVKDRREESYEYMPLELISADSVAFDSETPQNTIISCKKIGRGLAFLVAIKDMTSISGNRLKIADSFLKFISEMNADGIEISPSNGIEYILAQSENGIFTLFFTFYGTKILRVTPFNINKPMKGVEDWDGEIRFDKNYFKIKKLYRIKDINGIKEDIDFIETEDQYIVRGLKLVSFDHDVFQIVTDQSSSKGFWENLFNIF